VAAEIKREIRRPATTFEDVQAVVRVARGVAQAELVNLSEYTYIAGKQGRAHGAAYPDVLAEAESSHLEPTSLDWTGTEKPRGDMFSEQVQVKIGVTDIKMLTQSVTVSASGPELGRVLALLEALRRAFAVVDAETAVAERAAAEARQADRWIVRFWRENSGALIVGVVGAAAGVLGTLAITFLTA
jgi:hypothetical protein